MYAQILYINGHLKTMQLTMNSEVSVSNKANNLFSWLTKAAKKISAVFTKKDKKEQFAIDKNLSEAIAYIEWRTRYDQKRIVRYIYTASLQKDNPELYRALNMSLPVKHLWSDEKVNIEITDNTFERKLVRWFGDLNPTTKQLIDGVETENQRWVKKNVRITELLNRLPMRGTSSKLSLNGYEQQLLQVLKEQSVIARISTAPALLLPGTVTDSVQAEEIEVAINVVAETLPIETIKQPIEVEQPVKTTNKKAEKKTAKKKIFVKTEKKTKELAHCTIPEMKAFAKRKGFPVPGAITVKNDIQAYITEKFNELNNSN